MKREPWLHEGFRDATHTLRAGKGSTYRYFPRVEVLVHDMCLILNFQFNFREWRLAGLDIQSWSSVKAGITATCGLFVLVSQATYARTFCVELSEAVAYNRRTTRLDSVLHIQSKYLSLTKLGLVFHTHLTGHFNNILHFKQLVWSLLPQCWTKHVLRRLPSLKGQ